MYLCKTVLIYMEKKRILLCLAHMGGNEKKYIEEAFRTNWVVPLGPNVDAFEHELETYVGRNKKVLALSSGTAAIHLALKAVGVNPGDEVVCQSFTFCASCNPICYLGANPVFVDSERDSWNMDPELLDTAIAHRIAKTGKKPKAIIVVHLYGMPAKMNEILKVAKSYDIPVIEDAAEGMGSEYSGHLVGGLGAYGVFSFNGNKMITTSGGGALICPDEEAKSRALFYATQAREPFPWYQHEQIGYNYRLSNVCAGIGRGQMDVLSGHIAHHRHIASVYAKAFNGDDYIKFHGNWSGLSRPNFWLSTITLSPKLLGNGCVTNGGPAPGVENLRIALDRAGVEVRPLWKPLHLQPIFSRCPAYTNGVAEELFRSGLCLPSGPMVSDADVERIVSTISGFCLRCGV